MELTIEDYKEYLNSIGENNGECENVGFQIEIAKEYAISLLNNNCCNLNLENKKLKNCIFRGVYFWDRVSTNEDEDKWKEHIYICMKNNGFIDVGIYE